MSYTKKDFATRLEAQIAHEYDIVKISRWAYAEFLDNCRELEEGLDPEIMSIVAMESGPEFEMTKDELMEFISRLKNE